MRESPRRSPDSAPQPPVWVRWALAILLRGEDRRAVLNELAELYQIRRARYGEAGAEAWYRRQTMQYPLRLLADRLGAGMSRRPRTLSRPESAGRRGGSREAVQQVLHDIRHGARSLVRTPGSSLSILLTVGLGIGGTAAVFGVIHAVLWKSLPYHEPDRLVHIYTDSPPNRWPLSVVDYQAIEEQQSAFERVAAFQNRIVTFNHEDTAERIWVRFVTPDYFPALGVLPLHGRMFTRADAVPEEEPTAILAYRFWRERLGGDLDALGRSIRLDGNDYRVVGVLPPSTGPLDEGRDVFPILQMEPPERKGPFFLGVLGRLRPDVGMAAAENELRAINRRLFPIWKSSYSDATATFGAELLHAYVVGDVGTRLFLLLGAVGFVWLMASTNAANLLLARGARRERELAMRAALGASRGRLLQHLLSESAILALGGAGLGLLLTSMAIDILAAGGTALVPRAPEIRLDGPVLGFTATIAAGSLLLFGWIPSMQAMRSRFPHALHPSGGRMTGGLGSHRARRLLVAFQFTVAVPLLIGAGLLLASFAKLQGVDTGIDADHLLTLRITLPRSAYEEDAAVMSFWDRVTTRVGSIPGVLAVGRGTGRPPQEVGMLNNFNLEDDPTPPDRAEPVVPWPVVSKDYFRTLGIPLVRGRSFDDGDHAQAPEVAVVDQAWAKRFFPGKDPIGRRFHHGGCNRPECPWTTVIGVVGNVKYLGLDIPDQGTIYQPLAQNTWWAQILFVRTAGDPLSVLPAVRAVVREIDPSLPISDAATMNERVQEALSSPRDFLGLIAALAALALLLAAVGIYGVMSYFVQQHTRDIGIRMALGGSRSDVLLLVVGRGMALVVLGVSIGVMGAMALSRFMTSLLFEVSPTDPATFVIVTAGLVATGLAACALPARRAVGIDPALSLREE